MSSRISANSIVLSNPLKVVSGGTEVSSYTTGDILYASGATLLSKLPIGSNGTVLTSNGTTLGWSASSGSVSISAVNDDVQVSSTGSAYSIDIGSAASGTNSVKITSGTGDNLNGNDCVAIGRDAGSVTQKIGAVAIGADAGKTNQGQYSVAIGGGSGQTNQGNYSVGIGYGGVSSQGTECVAVGSSAGFTAQGNQSLAIGAGAAYQYQGTGAVSIGYYAGYDTQSDESIAIGSNAGYQSQNLRAIAIGNVAGNFNQSTGAVAMGSQAGQTGQAENSIAIGRFAGQYLQRASSVAIGYGAGSNEQKTGSVAVGNAAGSYFQGQYSVAIGSHAGETSQPDYAICIGGHSAASATQNQYSVQIGYNCSGANVNGRLAFGNNMEALTSITSSSVEGLTGLITIAWNGNPYRIPALSSTATDLAPTPTENYGSIRMDQNGFSGRGFTFGTSFAELTPTSATYTSVTGANFTAASNVLTYNGTATKLFRITAFYSMGTLDGYGIGIGINALPITSTYSYGGSYASVDALLQLATSDTISIYANRSSASSNNVLGMSLMVIALGS